MPGKDPFLGLSLILSLLPYDSHFHSWALVLSFNLKELLSFSVFDVEPGPVRGGGYKK